MGVLPGMIVLKEIEWKEMESSVESKDTLVTPVKPTLDATE